MDSITQKPIKIGVFIARFQPLHKAHMYVIEKALKECDRLVIMLGSSNKENMPRNPFNFRLRKELVSESLSNVHDMTKIQIYQFPDWSEENKSNDDVVWGHYLYYNIVSRINQKNFTLYYSDNPDIVKNWFDDEVKDYISFCFLDRKKVFEGLSSTKIRQALLNFTAEDKKYLYKSLPEAVFDRIEELHDIIVKVHKNPNKDFTMK